MHKHPVVVHSVLYTCTCVFCHHEGSTSTPVWMIAMVVVPWTLLIVFIMCLLVYIAVTKGTVYQ